MAAAHGILNSMTWLTWSLLSAVFAALTAILAKLGVAGVDSNLATAIRTSVVVVFTWLLAYGTRTPTWFSGFSNKTWLFLVLSGIATGLSWLCYFHALQIGPASRVAPVKRGTSLSAIASRRASKPSGSADRVRSRVGGWFQKRIEVKCLYSRRRALMP